MLRVLCIDHEGGHGGSSNSLYQLLKHVDQRSVQLEVWCRKESALLGKYLELGIPTRVTPELPVWKVDPSLYGTVSSLRNLGPILWRDRRALRNMAREIRENFDVVHLNNVSLQSFLFWLRKGARCGISLHMRHWAYTTRPVRWEMKWLSAAIDAFVFISENELERFKNLGGHGDSTVIYNVAPEVDSGILPDPVIAKDHRFKVFSINNFAFARGTDRLIDVAEALQHRGRSDIVFVVAGDIALSPLDPGDLGDMGRQGLSLRDYAEKRRVADMFLFLGHVDNVEPILVAGDLLVRLSRRADTWGRDVIEAMAHAKPVIAVGQWDGFVENDKTGIRIETFDADLIAEKICELADNQEQCRNLGEQAQRRIAQLCDGPSRAQQLSEVWQRLAAKPNRGSTINTNG
jgi:glycosyltransferase involved in cell wall biosynthesis